MDRSSGVFSVALAKISLNHLGIAHHRKRCSLCDEFTVMEHDHARAERCNYFHQMLDDQDGDPSCCDGLDQFECLIDLGGIQSGVDLIEQQERRPRRDEDSSTDESDSSDDDRPSRALSRSRSRRRPVNVLPPDPRDAAGGAGAGANIDFFDRLMASKSKFNPW